ncbi:transposase, partial [candidate division KSB1 bacterium]|nr:transposase [candidate division KSB1 bacterium]
FMRTLKYEEVYLTEYANEREALAAIRRFIDQVYNQERLHSRLGDVPPVEFETQYYQPALTP